jgi:hypothetical protein
LCDPTLFLKNPAMRDFPYIPTWRTLFQKSTSRGITTYCHPRHQAKETTTMQISDQVQAIINVLAEYSGGHLHDADALGQLLQHTVDAKRHGELGDLCFRGKHLSRVFETMAKQVPQSELHQKLQEEFSLSAREFHRQLQTFVEKTDTGLRQMVEQRYLAVTPEAMQQLLQLARDLEWLKNWQLDMEQ